MDQNYNTLLKYIDKVALKDDRKLKLNEVENSNIEVLVFKQQLL